MKSTLTFGDFSLELNEVNDLLNDGDDYLFDALETFLELLNSVETPGPVQTVVSRQGICAGIHFQGPL